MKIKEWIRIAVKTFINDCSIGTFLILLGFISGLMFHVIWSYFYNYIVHYVRIY